MIFMIINRKKVIAITLNDNKLNVIFINRFNIKMNKCNHVIRLIRHKCVVHFTCPLSEWMCLVLHLRLSNSILIGVIVETIVTTT